MIQFNVGGVLLDLPADINLTFTRKNMVLNFDKIEIQRSTSFEIPATPKNNSVMEQANDPVSYGSQMRTRLDAVMTYDDRVERGYLYISNASRSGYSCIFVFGALLGLKTIKEAGTIHDLLYNMPQGVEHGVYWADNPYTFAPTGASPAVRVIKYQNKVEDYIDNGIQLIPAIQVNFIIDQLLAKYTTKSALTFDCRDFLDPSTALYLVPPKVPLQTESATWHFYMDNYDEVNVNNMQFYFDIEYRYWGATTPYADPYRTAFFRCRTACKITFSDDFPSELFVVNDKKKFLGGYSFKIGKSSKVSGKSLSGQTITFNTGDLFTFVSNVDGVDTYRLNNGTYTDINGGVHNINAKKYFYWYYGAQVDAYNNNWITFQRDAEVLYGEPVFARDFMPDINVLDLMRTFCLCAYEHESYGMRFVKVGELNAAQKAEMQQYVEAHPCTTPLDAMYKLEIIPLKWKTEQTHSPFGDKIRYIHDSELIDIKEVQRTYSDFAQNNIIQFDSADYVNSSQKQVLNYAIDNINLAESKNIYTIPFSEGANNDAVEGVGTLFIDDIRQNVNADGNVSYDIDGQKWTIARYNSASDSLVQVSLPQNDILNTLCDNSTQIKAKFLMPFREFQELDECVLIQVQNVRYLWSEGQWSSGVASMTLHKVADKYISERGERPTEIVVPDLQPNVPPQTPTR